MAAIRGVLGLIILILTNCIQTAGAEPGSSPANDDQKADEIALKIVEGIIENAADMRVHGYGPMDASERGSVTYFMLYVREFQGGRIRSIWSTRIQKEEMKRVLLVLAENGLFSPSDLLFSPSDGLLLPPDLLLPPSDEESPDRNSWRFCVFGPGAEFQSYYTEQEYKTILKGITKVLPNGFKMKGKKEEKKD